MTNADCTGITGGSAELEVSGGAGLYDYSWSNGMQTNAVDNLAAGIYALSVTDANNCTKEYEIEIGIDDVEVPLEFNNVFSPNYDGINDLFVIENLELYPDNELVILNRWGNEIYTMKSYDNLWDGSDLSEGTYFYILKVNMCIEVKSFSGYITILR